MILSTGSFAYVACLTYKQPLIFKNNILAMTIKYQQSKEKQQLLLLVSCCSFPTFTLAKQEKLSNRWYSAV